MNFHDLHLKVCWWFQRPEKVVTFTFWGKLTILRDHYHHLFCKCAHSWPSCSNPTCDFQKTSSSTHLAMSRIWNAIFFCRCCWGRPAQSFTMHWIRKPFLSLWPLLFLLHGEIPNVKASFVHREVELLIEMQIFKSHKGIQSTMMSHTPNKVELAANKVPTLSTCPILSW